MAIVRGFFRLTMIVKSTNLVSFAELAKHTYKLMLVTQIGQTCQPGFDSGHAICAHM